MPAYNRNFDIDMADLDVIEASLRERVKTLSAARMEQPCLDSERDLRATKALLGRLHNQKVFYRPTSGYIGG